MFFFSKGFQVFFGDRVSLNKMMPLTGQPKIRLAGATENCSDFGFALFDLAWVVEDKGPLIGIEQIKCLNGPAAQMPKFPLRVFGVSGFRSGFQVFVSQVFRFQFLEVNIFACIVRCPIPTNFVGQGFVYSSCIERSEHNRWRCLSLCIIDCLR